MHCCCLATMITLLKFNLNVCKNKTKLNIYVTGSGPAILVLNYSLVRFLEKMSPNWDQIISKFQTGPKSGVGKVF